MPFARKQAPPDEGYRATAYQYHEPWQLSAPAAHWPLWRAAYGWLHTAAGATLGKARERVAAAGSDVADAAPRALRAAAADALAVIVPGAALTPNGGKRRAGGEAATGGGVGGAVGSGALRLAPVGRSGH